MLYNNVKADRNQHQNNTKKYKWQQLLSELLKSLARLTLSWLFTSHSTNHLVILKMTLKVGDNKLVLWSWKPKLSECKYLASNHTLRSRAGTAIQAGLATSPSFAKTHVGLHSSPMSSILSHCQNLVGKGLVWKIWGSLRRRMPALPIISWGIGKSDKGLTWSIPRSLWLFPGAKQTQKEPLLKEHSVFPSLLTSPGPVPVIIGKHRVWFFWDWNQCCEECSDNKCCWLTLDGQCSWVSFSWAGFLAENCTKQLLSSVLPGQTEFTALSLCGPQSGSQARLYLRSPPAPSFNDSIKKRTQIQKHFFSPNTELGLLFTHRNTDSNREITRQKISSFNSSLIVFDPIIPLVRIYLKGIIQPGLCTQKMSALALFGGNVW